MVPTETPAKPADTPAAKPSAQSEAKPAANRSTARPAKASAQKQAKPASKPAAKTSARSKAKPARTTAARAGAATARTTKVADRFVSAQRAAGHQPAFGGREWAVRLLDVQEQTVRSVADYQLRAADSTRLPWVATIARGQADVLVGVTDAYVSAARRLLVK